MKLIKLNNGYAATVDDDDYNELIKFKWFVVKRGGLRYAKRMALKNDLNCPTQISMHRQIMGVVNTKKIIDHKNRNALDNRKQNLRECTQSENSKNRKSRILSTSIYLGVHWCKRSKKWKAVIDHNGVKNYLGIFINEIDAAKAYDKAAKKYHKEFANLNFKQ
jgi:hypothetical protein